MFGFYSILLGLYVSVFGTAPTPTPQPQAGGWRVGADNAGGGAAGGSAGFWPNLCIGYLADLLRLPFTYPVELACVAAQVTAQPPNPSSAFRPARSIHARGHLSLAKRSGRGLQTSATGESAPSIIRSIVRTKGVGGLYNGELSPSAPLACQSLSESALCQQGRRRTLGLRCGRPSSRLSTTRYSHNPPIARPSPTVLLQPQPGLAKRWHLIWPPR